MAMDANMNSNMLGVFLVTFGISGSLHKVNELFSENSPVVEGEKGDSSDEIPGPGDSFPKTNRFNVSFAMSRKERQQAANYEGFHARPIHSKLA